jgi:hypothetical protein
MKKRGCILRNMREDDEITLAIGGVEIGTVTIKRVPNDAKIKVAFCFDQSVRITRAVAKSVEENAHE